MKKVISLALALVMLASMLVINVSAANTPFGTVVEVPFTDKAPSMAAALPDDSWGKPLAHVDGKSANAGITQYKPSGKVKQDLSFDLYGAWDEENLYICFTSPDPDFTGGLRFWWGDGVQMVVVPGAVDISYCNNESMGWTSREEFEMFDWCVSFDIDDETPISSDIADGKSIIYGDTKTNTLVVKFAMDKVSLGYNKSEKLKANDLFSFALNRIDGSLEDPNMEAYIGWLEWGNFHDTSKTWAPDDPLQFTKTADNPVTKTANTFKLVGTASSAPVEEKPEEPVKPVEDPTPLVGQPSIWAEEEVKKAIAEGLVPADLQKDYTKGISRADLSKILSALVDKVYGKAPTDTSAKFKDTTDTDVLKAANLGLIKGYDAGNGEFNFKPANTLKRSEMSAIINRVAKLCGKTTTGFDAEVKFADTVNHWCNSELGWPVHNGIVKGTSATQFSPENTLTVEQTIMMIYRTYEALK